MGVMKFIDLKKLEVSYENYPFLYTEVLDIFK